MHGMMTYTTLLIIACGLFAANAQLIDGFRPPAVPLIVFDPFMNIWSMSDNLYDNFPQLWCGPTKGLAGGIRVDGKTYRFMGPKAGGIFVDDVIKQTNVKVEPTQTYYTFSNDQVELSVVFTTPTIPTSLHLLSLPITYITFGVSSKDGQDHQVELYFDQTAEIVVNDQNEEVFWTRVEAPANGPKIILKMGSVAQKILGKAGDCDAINWGYSYIAVDPIDNNDIVTGSIGAAATLRAQFVSSGTLPQDETNKPRKANDNWPASAILWSFKVTSNQPQQRHLTFAYDDVQSVNFFGTRMVPYWRRDGLTAVDLLVNAKNDYDLILFQCKRLDDDIVGKLFNSANAEYATLGALAFRQTFGGCKLVWNEEIKGPWYVMKEISSNGDFQTVDVVFPASTMFLYTNPYLMELLLLPLLSYANNETYLAYDLPWSPHHLGTYPIADCPASQQENMPVEESGNLLMIIATLVKYSKQQGADYQSQIFPKYAALIKSWADFLIVGDGVLPDPDDQLSTDDFLGPSPHNTNLALKGIVGLGCYAEICSIQGNTQDAQKYGNYAKTYVDFWMKNALDNDHYKLQYDLPNSWSLKYNLIYQYIVGVDIFPQSLIDTELSFLMKNHFNTYGIPLNSQATFTKLDWVSWMAAMANPQDRLLIFKSLYNLANQTKQRVPLTDWYDTISGDQRGFQARPVVGALYGWLLLHSQKQNATQVDQPIQFLSI